MNKILICLILISTMSFAQHPVKWNFSFDQTKSLVNIKYNADIEKGWHIYSQNTPDGGPLPMLFTYDSTVCYSLLENVIEPDPIEEFDSVFAITVKYLEGSPSLSQKIQILSTPCNISGRIDYQACKDICIPLDTTFSITIKRE